MKAVTFITSQSSLPPWRFCISSRWSAYVLVFHYHHLINSLNQAHMGYQGLNIFGNKATLDSRFLTPTSTFKSLSRCTTLSLKCTNSTGSYSNFFYWPQWGLLHAHNFSQSGCFRPDLTPVTITGKGPIVFTGTTPGSRWMPKVQLVSLRVWKWVWAGVLKNRQLADQI